MATDLASPVGLGHPDEEEYIDYSDDEPETSPVKPTSESTSYFESAQPTNTVQEDVQDFSVDAVDLTSVNIDPAAQVANDTSEHLPQSDAILADGIDHDDPASIEQAVPPSNAHLTENEITWDEDEGKDDRHEDDEFAQHGPIEHTATEPETKPDADTLSTALGLDVDMDHGQTLDDHNDASAQEAQSSVPQELSRDSIDDADNAAETADLTVPAHDDLNEIDYEDDDAMAAAPEKADVEASLPGDGDAVPLDLGVRDDGDYEPGDQDTSRSDSQADAEPTQEALEPSSAEESASHEATADGGDDGEGPYSAAEPHVDNEAFLADSSVASLDTPEEEEDAEMPVVTVLWHGVEYPLFYNSAGSEGRDCFFHDLSVLQCKMEELLASLRRVLADDVADSDELVLQVEELGLEFAESSHPDQFSEITLGSILQVFDHLVKNKDPEATRPMYALLITRPNCSKRWSSLIEDAWNGKNIDEVSYSFNSREEDAMEDAEVEAEDAEMFLNQDLDDEMGDEFGDLVEHENSADNAPHDSFDEGGKDPEPADDDEHGADAPDVDGLGLAEDTTLPDELELGAPFDTVTSGVIASGEGLDAANAADAALLGDVAGLGESDAATDAVAAALSTFDEAVTTAAVLEESAVTQVTEEAEGEAQMTSDPNAPLPNDAFNPLLVAETGDNSLDGPQLTVGDGGAGAALDVNSAITSVDNPRVEQATPDTSATATLDGEEIEDLGAEIDLTADMTQDEQAVTADVGSEHGPNDLEEIDWRDFPGDGDEELSHESTSVSGKRPRADEDDLLGAEDEQDAKRLRS